MAIGIAGLIDAITSHASRSGYFAQVQGFEPKSMPGGGPGPDLLYAVFLSNLSPARAASGLAAATARVELTGRIYKPFMSQPEDLIDPNLAEAGDALFEAYVGDFELGGTARNIDVFGTHGGGLSARAGYQTVDKSVYRVLDITIPIIVNDAWQESP
jgi:hypothetical protein